MLTQLRSCVIDSKLALAVVLATQIVNSILSEWGTDVKCIRECNHRGRSVVFEAVAMSTTFSAWSVFLQRRPVVIVSAGLCHEGHSQGAPQNFSKKLWQFPTRTNFAD